MSNWNVAPKHLSTNMNQIQSVDVSTGSTTKIILVVIVSTVIVLLGAAAIAVPIALSLTNTGPFSTTKFSSTSSITVSANGTTFAASTTTATVASTITTTVASTTTTTVASTTTTTGVPTTTTAALPSQCSSYATISDATRLTTAAGGSVCDSSVFSSSIIWVRFTAPGGTQVATTPPSANQCGTQATGWYSGTMPSSGSTVNGTACYVWGSNTCNWNNNIRVTNCGSFYVFGLILPPICNARYCTA